MKLVISLSRLIVVVNESVQCVLYFHRTPENKCNSRLCKWELLRVSVPGCSLTFPCSKGNAIDRKFTARGWNRKLLNIDETFVTIRSLIIEKDHIFYTDI